LQDRVRRTFAACRRAVEAELVIGDLRRSASAPADNEATAEPAAGAAAMGMAAEPCAAARNGTHPPAAQSGPQNGATAPADEDELAAVSASQLRYVRRLASSIGRAAALRVEVLAERSYGKPLGELSRAEASRLIAMLRAVKAGELDWETLLEQAAA